MAKKPREPSLYWNRFGKVGCQTHLPEKDGPLWKLEEWKKMTNWQLTEMKNHTGKMPTCQTCDPPVKRSPIPSR